jgi:hypothetical protein
MGFFSNRILASAGVRPPLRRLQTTQHVTILAQSAFPPRERGITWSQVRFPAEKCFPQYWQVCWSRAYTFLREYFASRRRKRTNPISLTTDGIIIESLTERTSRSDSSTTSTFSMKTSLTARFQLITLSGSKDAFSKRTCSKRSSPGTWPSGRY